MERVKIMINSGNTVGDLVSEEFPERLGLEGDEIQDHIAVPTTAATTTLLVVKRCQGVTARLEGIAGEFTIRPLVVRGLTHPVNLGQHFLGRGPNGKLTPVGQGGEGAWRGRGVIAAGGEGVQVRATAVDH